METVVIYPRARGTRLVPLARRWHPAVSLYADGRIGLNGPLCERLRDEKFRIEVAPDGDGRVLRLVPDPAGFSATKSVGASLVRQIRVGAALDRLDVPWDTLGIPAEVGEDGAVTVRLPKGEAA